MTTEEERIERLRELVVREGWNPDFVDVERVAARGAPVASVGWLRYTDTVIRGDRPMGLFEIVDDERGSFENRPVGLAA